MQRLTITSIIGCWLRYTSAVTDEENFYTWQNDTRHHVKWIAAISIHEIVDKQFYFTWNDCLILLETDDVYLKPFASSRTKPK